MKAFQSANLAQTESFGVSKTYNMEVDQTKAQKLIMLLTSGLYSNPIGSLVREITSNCFDAHKEVGTDEPVVIDLSRSRIRFIDVGPGLTPKRVEDIYSKYLASTKETDLNQIGSWGLGSKSPLAYTDMFTIITRVDGIQYTYVMRKDALGTAIDKISETKTDQRNGTEIVVEIKNEDHGKFVRELRTQLCYFPNIHFKGEVDIQPGYNIYEGKTFLYSPIGNKLETHISLGGVAYPIDWAAVGLGKHTTPIGIKFAIGEIPVTPNREGVIWTKDSAHLLLKKIKAVGQELADLYEAKSTNLYIKYLVESDSYNRFISLGGNRVPVCSSFRGGYKQSYNPVYTGKLKIKHSLQTYTTTNFLKAYSFDVGNHRHKQGLYIGIDSLLSSKCYYVPGNLSPNKSRYICEELHDAYFVKIDTDSYRTSAEEKEAYVKVVQEWVDSLDNYDDVEVPESYLKTLRKIRPGRSTPLMDRTKVILGEITADTSGYSAAYSYNEEYYSNIDYGRNDIIVIDMVKNKKKLGKLAMAVAHVPTIKVAYTAKRNIEPLLDEDDNFITYEEFMEGKTKQFSDAASALYIAATMRKDYKPILDNRQALEKVRPARTKEVFQWVDQYPFTSHNTREFNELAKTIVEIAEKNRNLEPGFRKTLKKQSKFLKAAQNIQYVNTGYYHNNQQALDFFDEYLTLKRL